MRRINNHIQTTATIMQNKPQLLLLLFFCISFYSEAQCGSERWETKTLSDAEATKIKFSSIMSTVHDQLAFPKPAYHENNKRDQTEKQVYRIECILVKYKVEDDKDWHLVVQDLQTNEQMVVEIPDPDNCNEVKGNTHLSKLAKVRKRIVAHVGPVTDEYRKPPEDSKKIIVTGVGFFDKKNHPQGF